jgi:hypothetical protein
VGIFCSLTRCRSGLTGTVATCSGYRSRRRSVLVTLPIDPTESFKGAVKPASRVHVPDTSTVGIALRVTDGLDGEPGKASGSGRQRDDLFCKCLVGQYDASKPDNRSYASNVDLPITWTA